MPRIKPLKLNYMVTDLHIILSSFRKRSKLSQQEVADSIGCTRQYVSDIENGKNIPGYEFLIRFLAAVKPTDDDLIKLMKGWDA